MKRKGRTKFFTAWLLIAALTLPPLTGVAEANDTEESTLGDAIESAITTGTSGDVVPKVFVQKMSTMSEGGDAGIMPLALTEGDSDESSIAIGTDSYARRGGIAIGDDARTTPTSNPDSTGIVNGIAIGTLALVDGSGGISIGYRSTTKVVSSVALGEYSRADRVTTSSDVYIPSGADPAKVSDTVIFRQGIMGDKLNAGTVSIGNLSGTKTASLTRQLTGLAAGVEDYDAVNVAQLKALDSVTVRYTSADAKDEIILGKDENSTASIRNLTAEDLADNGKFAATTGQVYTVGDNTVKKLGDSFGLGADGTVTGDFKYRSTQGLNTVQSVFETISGDVTANETNIASLGQKTASALGGNSSYTAGTLTTELTVGDGKYTSVQEALSAVDDMAVKYDDAEEGNSITLKGNGGTTISGLKEADISNTSTQAVSGKQLFAVSTDVAGKYNELGDRISDNTDIITAVSDDFGKRIAENAKNIGDLGDIAVKYDKGKNSVTLVGADENANVTLKNVAAGAEGNDAVNVSQLNDALGILGNGAVVDNTNGTITKNDFAYRSNAGLDTVHKVFYAVSGDVAANETKIDAIGGVLGEDYKNPRFNSATITSATIGGMTMNDSGINMTNKKITGLADGTELTDAVNFGQLSAVSADLGARIENLRPGEGGTTDDSVVKYDDDKKSVTLGGADDAPSVTLKNVAAGAEGTDAVNVSQLNDALGILGNGAAVDDTNGSIKNSGFAYRSNTGFNTVQDVFNAVSGDVTANQTKIDAIGKVLGDGYVKPNFDSATIGGMKMSSTGIAMNNQKITGLADGTELTDAVNFGQLNEAKQSIETLSSDVTIKYSGLNDKIGDNATAIGLLQDSMGIVSGDLAGIAGEISDFKNHITESEASIVDHDGRIEDLEELSVKYNADMSEIKLGDTTTRAAGDPVLISNLRGGDISQGSDQAITGGQLYSFGNNIKDAFGGATQFANGVLSVDLTVGDQTYNSVQDALTGLATGAGSVTSGDFGWTLKVDGEGQTVSAGTVLSISSSNNIDIAKNGNNAYVFNLKDDITVDSVTLNNAAEIKAGGMEASTVGQLHSLGESAANILGGNFLLTDGKLDGSFTVNGTEYKTVQEALKAAAESGSGSGTGTGSWTLSVNGKETNIGDGGKFAIASGSNVEINKNEAGAYELGVVKNPEFESIKVGNINIREEGINMGGNTITGLANGGIYQGSSDAVTGDQLWNAYRRIDTIDERVQVVGAHAAALSALHPVPYNPYEPTTFSAGFGYYRNEQSVAVGVFHYVRENVLVNAGFSLNSDGDTMGRAGISFAIGKSGRKQPSMVKDVASMQQQMAAMQQMLVELKEENEKNKETIDRNENTIQELKEELKKALEEKK